MLHLNDIIIDITELINYYDTVLVYIFIMSCSIVGSRFLDFTASAVMQDGSINESFCLSDYIRDKYAILFFYPLDFTFVCPSELVSMSNSMHEFEKRNSVVMSVSVDSHFCHAAWRKTPLNSGGIGEVNFPMISDLKKEISKDYGALVNDAVACRATTIIDKNGIVQVHNVKNLPIGRSTDEIIRLVDAIQHHEEYGEVCPMNWKKGESAMKPTPEGVASYLSEMKV